MANAYYNLDTRAAEDFMVFLHQQKYRLVNEQGSTVSLLKAMEDYGQSVQVQQKEIDEQHVSRCGTEKVCLSCGEPGFPFCDRHDGTDPYEGALPEITDDAGDDPDQRLLLRRLIGTSRLFVVFLRTEGSSSARIPTL